MTSNTTAHDSGEHSGEIYSGALEYRRDDRANYARDRADDKPYNDYQDNRANGLPCRGLGDVLYIVEYILEYP